MCKHKRAWLQVLPSFAVLEPKAISRRLSDPLITQHALSLRSDCWTILRTSNREPRYPRCGLIPFNSFFFLSAVYVYIVQAPSLLSIYLCLYSLWVSISVLTTHTQFMCLYTCVYTLLHQISTYPLWVCLWWINAHHSYQSVDIPLRLWGCIA